MNASPVLLKLRRPNLDRAVRILEDAAHDVIGATTSACESRRAHRALTLALLRLETVRASLGRGEALRRLIPEHTQTIAWLATRTLDDSWERTCVLTMDASSAVDARLCALSTSDERVDAVVDVLSERGVPLRWEERDGGPGRPFTRRPQVRRTGAGRWVITQSGGWDI